MDKLLKIFDSHPHWKDGLLCFFSAGLLMLAFPKTDLGWAAWVGLIPLMSALDGKKPWAAFRSGYLCGVLFFAGTFYWFFHIARWFSYIAVIGVVLLFLYLALYFGVFALGYSFFSRRKLFSKLFLLPSVWVVLEFIRARLFTGFDWACLGHSQYKNLLLIQIADVTGVLGVSFLVVMVNVFLKEWLAIRRVSGAGKPLVYSALTVALAGFLILGYGTFHLLLPAGQVQAASRLSVVIIQADIPQELKW
jgi:apolipoprotein N-acyltransferase